MRGRFKLMLLEAGGFLASSLPLVGLLLARWEHYVQVPLGGVRLCFGGGVIVLLLWKKAMGKLRMPRRATVLVLALALSYLLEAMLSELPRILWAALAGELADAWLFARPAARLRARLEAARGESGGEGHA